MTTPELHLQTLFVLDADGRITSTREPGGGAGPLFELVRGATSCAWAVRADVPYDLSRELDRVAQQEPPISDFLTEPAHAERYRSVLARAFGQSRGVGLHKSLGPAFEFPEVLADPGPVAVIENEQVLQGNFSGWMPGEIQAGRAPVIGVVEQNGPVSICFCARSSSIAAEAGVETVERFRGRGLGARVTAAWGAAVRASGRTPLYSTDWTNIASLALARRLGLRAYASGWALYE